MKTFDEIFLSNLSKTWFYNRKLDIYFKIIDFSEDGFKNIMISKNNGHYELHSYDFEQDEMSLLYSGSTVVENINTEKSLNLVSAKHYLSIGV